MSKYKKVIIAVVIVFFLVPTLMFSGSRYFLNRGVELMDESPEEARKNLDRAAKLNPFCGEVYGYIARTMYDTGKLEGTPQYGKVDVDEDVLRKYEKALEKGMSQRWVYEDLGTIFYNKSIYYGAYLGDLETAKDKLEKAKEYLTEANRIEEDEYDYYKIGYMYLEVLSDFEEAKNYFEIAKNVNPDYSYPYAGIGHVYMRQGNYTEALNYLEEAKEIEPNPFIYSGLAYTYLRITDNYRVAIPYYREILDLDPDYLGAYYNLAVSYKRIGDEDGALYYLNELRDRDSAGTFTQRVENSTTLQDLLN